MTGAGPDDADEGRGADEWACDPENANLISLARLARARVAAPAGAAVRDETGRTHVGATVSRGGLSVTALALAAANALASGARSIAAAAVVTDDPDLDAVDRQAIRGLLEDLGRIAVCDPAGTVRRLIAMDA